MELDYNTYSFTFKGSSLDVLWMLDYCIPLKGKNLVVFVHVDLEEVGFSALQWVPGATGFVTFGTQPSIVPDALILAVRKKVDAINMAGGEIFHEIHQGDTVEIRSGPFAGYEAIFDVRLPGTERVRVLLKLLQGRAAKLEVPAGVLKKK